jgi:1,4-alpha-glucan branching enzyme
MLVVCNFAPVARHGYRVGAPRPGRWVEVANSDAEIYGGSGDGNAAGVVSEREPAHGHPQSLALTLPPLSIIFLEHVDEGR